MLGHEFGQKEREASRIGKLDFAETNHQSGGFMDKFIKIQRFMQQLFEEEIEAQQAAEIGQAILAAQSRRNRHPSRGMVYGQSAGGSGWNVEKGAFGSHVGHDKPQTVSPKSSLMTFSQRLSPLFNTLSELMSELQEVSLTFLEFQIYYGVSKRG
jgi:hypothetical protein